MTPIPCISRTVHAASDQSATGVKLVLMGEVFCLLNRSPDFARNMYPSLFHFFVLRLQIQLLALPLSMSFE